MDEYKISLETIQSNFTSNIKEISGLKIINEQTQHIIDNIPKIVDDVKTNKKNLTQLQNVLDNLQNNFDSNFKDIFWLKSNYSQSKILTENLPKLLETYESNKQILMQLQSFLDNLQNNTDSNYKEIIKIKTNFIQTQVTLESVQISLDSNLKKINDIESKLKITISETNYSDMAEQKIYNHLIFIVGALTIVNFIVVSVILTIIWKKKDNF
jgi:chromosome segregation ATPase